MTRMAGASPAAVPSVPAMPIDTYRILVVEDHPATRARAVASFLQLGRHAVQAAADGREALLRLEQGGFDLVLGKLRLPRLDGVQLIRKLPVRASAPALALVGDEPQRMLRGAAHLARLRGLGFLGVFPRVTAASGASMVLGALSHWRGQPQAERAVLPGEPDRDALEQALDSGAIHARFQPKLSLRTNTISSAEALARWRHPRHGLLPPAAFLPAIERAGLSERLLWAMLEQSLAARRQWAAQGFDIGVSLNIHTRLLDQPDLPDRLHRHVTARDVSPSSICFELTETSDTQDAANYYAGACRLRLLGFGLSQDDFSHGYSSFHRLLSTPFTEMKIDRSLVRGAASDAAFAAALESVAQLGRRLGMSVVGEGVESDEQMQLLREAGCDAVQGYLVAPALDRDEFGRLLDAYRGACQPTMAEHG